MAVSIACNDVAVRWRVENMCVIQEVTPHYIIGVSAADIEMYLFAAKTCKLYRDYGGECRAGSRYSDKQERKHTQGEWEEKEGVHTSVLSAEIVCAGEWNGVTMVDFVPVLEIARNL